MKTTLVSIPTETLGLEGAWHEPEGRAVGAVLLLHGNTMNFFTGAPRFLPPALTRMGLACLAFNRNDAVDQHQRLVGQADPGRVAVDLGEVGTEHITDLADGEFQALLAIQCAWRCAWRQRR